MAPSPSPSPAPATLPAGAPGPSCRAHASDGFGPLLARLGVSLLVSTYQANKLMVLRADPRDPRGGLNVHLRQFDKPMGVALAGDRLAVGTAREVREYHNAPAVARTIDAAAGGGGTGAARHDACFVPRLAHVTGDVQVHEMAWVSGSGGGAGAPHLWFVNTRFSCLAVRSALYSFVPVWRPPFVTALAPEDRCHLNGLGLRDGLPRYATALGETDAPAGWRDNKKAGGILMRLPDGLGPLCPDSADAPGATDAASGGEVIVRGLSMPHSPRWHAGRLWVLESGRGTISLVDEATGRCHEVARLPGFARGLDFAASMSATMPPGSAPPASVAFLGLSQIRESAVFSGIPIADLPQSQRRCGVWAVDIATGQTLAYLQFDVGVQEIFAVQVCRHRYPEVLEDAQKDLIDGSFILPRQALRQVPAPLRKPASG